MHKIQKRAFWEWLYTKCPSDLYTLGVSLLPTYMHNIRIEMHLGTMLNTLYRCFVFTSVSLSLPPLLETEYFVYFIHSCVFFVSSVVFRFIMCILERNIVEAERERKKMHTTFKCMWLCMRLSLILHECMSVCLNEWDSWSDWQMNREQTNERPEVIESSGTGIGNEKDTFDV